MTIAISFDPTDDNDLEYVRNLLSVPEETPASAKPKKTKAAAPAEEEATEDEATGPTLEDAVERATELVGEGRAADVKGALANFGVKRVSELEESQVAEFLAALSEDSIV